MKKSILWIGLIAGILVFQPIITEASGHQKSKECKVGELKDQMKILWTNQEALKISDQQLDTIKDIKHEAVKQLIQLQADKEIIAVDLKSFMNEDVIDVNKVNPLIDEKYRAKAEIKKAYTKAVSDVQQVLNAQQRAQWEQMYNNDDKTGYGNPKQHGKGCEKGCDCSKGMEKKSEIKNCPITGRPLDK